MTPRLKTTFYTDSNGLRRKRVDVVPDEPHKAAPAKQEKKPPRAATRRKGGASK